MTAAEVLADLTGHGAVVWLSEQGTLEVESPRGVLTDTHRAAIRQHKAALVALLRQPPWPPELPADLRELWEERAAIMEYAGGLPRAEAERQALRCVLGLPTEGTEAPCGRVAS